MNATETQSLKEYADQLATRARAASRAAVRLTTAQKNDALERIAASLLEHQDALQAENRKDLDAAEKAGISGAFFRRLQITDKVLQGMAACVRDIIQLPDPVGEITDVRRRPSGIEVGRMRIPLGVILFIYESRPNVTTDAAALCLKSGNSVLLRGGSEARRTNAFLGGLIQDALAAQGIDPHIIQPVANTDREVLSHLFVRNDCIDLCVPRGGAGLIRAVSDQAKMPVLKHFDGICHVYVDETADFAMARRIILNAKVQNPGVCNTLETALVDRAVAAELLPPLIADLREAGVEVRGCEGVRAIDPEVKAATEEDWRTEYLDMILALRVVDGLDAAMDHIANYGSRHTDTIVTNHWQRAQRFLREVDSSSVMVNASTRFADGNEYGLGAEVGISTDKLHAFGPMGLAGLTTQKFVVFGDGHLRQ